MIYQLTAYYRALIGDKVTYSAEITLDNCTKFLTKDINCEEIKKYIIHSILLLI
jgi:hypothetical protein